MLLLGLYQSQRRLFDSMKQLFASDPIIRFYSGTGTDDCGRRIEEIWQWDHVRFEGVHNYIQWLFPLEPSVADRLPHTDHEQKSVKLLAVNSLQAVLPLFTLVPIARS